MSEERYDLSDHDLLIRIDTRVNAMHKEVFGNGRPGILSRLTTLEAGAVRKGAAAGGVTGLLAGALAIVYAVVS